MNQLTVWLTLIKALFDPVILLHLYGLGICYAVIVIGVSKNNEPKFTKISFCFVVPVMAFVTLVIGIPFYFTMMIKNTWDRVLKNSELKSMYSKRIKF